MKDVILIKHAMGQKLFSTYADSATNRPLQSNPSMVATSSADNSKLNTSKLLMIRLFVTDFGMTALPRWIWYRMRICAGDFLFFSAIAMSFGSSIN